MWEPYQSRRDHHGVQLYGALKIDRNDAAARLTQYKRNYEFFNAPIACSSPSIAGSAPASGPISAAISTR